MVELTLEPYAVVQHWHLPGADGHWEGILSDYLQTLARRCSASGQTVIGHIKAIAVFPQEGYFRASVVAPNLPAGISGSVPPGCVELALTLNVLVYGLAWTTIQQITLETSEEIASQWKGVVSHRNLNEADQHLHHSDHQAQKERNDE